MRSRIEAGRAVNWGACVQRRARSGLTLIDMMITTAVIAVVAASVVPVALTNERTIVSGAVRRLVADIEYAQVRSITDPGSPTTVRLAVDGTGYWLADADTPDIPMDIPPGAVGSGDPFQVVFGGYRGQSLDGVTIAVDRPTGFISMTFDQYGRLTISDDVEIEVSFVGSSMRVTVNAFTGTIRTE